MNPFDRKYTTHIPVGIDLDYILQSYHAKFKIHGDNAYCIKDRAAFLLSQISMGTLNDNRIIDKKGFTQLSSSILQSNVKNYKEYMTYFQRLGIIEVDKKYSNFGGREKCKGYKFTKHIDTSAYYNHYIYDKRFLSSLYKWQRPKETINKYDYLYKWFSQIELSLDVADRVLDHTNQHQRDWVKNIGNEYSWSFQQKKTNRIFTHITKLKKELRQQIHFGGVPTIEIDIKNSIPFFSIVLFNNRKLITDDTIKQYLKESNEYIVGNLDALYNYQLGEGIGGNSMLSCSSYLMLGEYDQLADNFTDIDNYRNKVLDGSLYNYLAERWNDSLNTEYDRSSAKKKLMTILNSPSHYKNGEREILVAEYPNVMKLVDRLNYNYFITGKRKLKRKYKHALDCPFAYFTQKMEAHFLLDRVCRRIAEDFPDCPMYTVHDAIGTTEAYKEVIIEIMKEESLDWIDEEVQCEVEYPEQRAAPISIYI